MTDDIAEALYKLLKLPKRTVWFELRCCVGEKTKIKCAYYPEDLAPDDPAKLQRVLSEYTLEKKNTAGGYDPRLYQLAISKEWKLPGVNPLGPEPWNRYWSQMEAYEADPDQGRPVIPHRSG